MDKLWKELQRRHVVRVGSVYALLAWLLAQIADLVLDNFNAPSWVMQSFLFVLVAGFPIAIIIGWAFELTPRGFRREKLASSDAESNDTAPASSSVVLRYTIWIGATLSLAAVLLLSTRFAEQQRTAPKEVLVPRFVVAVFENGIGDTSLDSIGRLAADVIGEGLQRTGIVDVVPPNTALHISRTIVGQGDPVARLAQETGATHAVAGTYYRSGDVIQFHAQVIDMSNDVNRRQHVAIEPVEGPYDRPSEAIDALRQRVMGVVASIIDPRIEQPAELMGHLPSYAAYRAFIEGLEIFWRSDYAGSRRHFQRAIELDPDYDLPRILLIFSHHNVGEWAESEPLVGELERRRDELSPYESYRLDQLIAAAKGDMEAAYQAAHKASSISAEFGPVMDGASYAIALNRPQEAIEAMQTIDTNRVLIGWTEYWEGLTAARHMLGDHDEELKEALIARAQYPDSLRVIFTESRARAALGDTEGVQSLLDASINMGAQPGWTVGGLFRATGEELIAHGKVDAGRETLAQAVTWYQTRLVGEKERLRFNLALTLLSAGRVDETIALLELLDQEDPNRFFILGALGVANALQGDRANAERISVQLEGTREPYSFGGTSFWQAQIAAALGNKDQAMVFLQRAFSEGRAMGDWIHREPAFRSLIDHPPFQALLQPIG
jgi:tetratricopeptide (TPR) repeat protein/TolB-like protein